MFADIFNAYRELIVFGLSTALLVILIYRFWERISLWALNVIYRFPFIGKLSGLSKDFSRGGGGEDRWYKSERTVCSDYAKHIRVRDRRQFLECQVYLAKAGDQGRSPFPIFIWVLIIVLVFIEAMGFSYVLAGMTVPGASEAVQQQASYGIAFMIAVILVAFTHFAGHELHRSNLIKKARTEWQEDNDGNNHNLVTKAPSLQVALNRNDNSQAADDNAPAYAQLTTRVGTQPSYAITGMTAILIAVVALGATYVRGQVLERTLTEETTGATQSFYGDLPAEITGAQAEADKRAKDEITDTTRTAGWGTFVVLAFVFIFLQILGILFGMNWGFAGKESKLAYKLSGGKRFDTYEDFKSHYYDRIADVAQSMLEHLRHNMQARAQNRGSKGFEPSRYSFVDYLEEKMRKSDQASEAMDWDLRQVATKAAPKQTGQNHEASAEPDDARFYYAAADNQASNATCSIVELEALLQQGVITLSTQVYQEGGGDWQPYSAVRPQNLPPLRPSIPPPPPAPKRPPPPPRAS